MGKLATYVAMRKDIAFEFEREVRAVRDLFSGITSIGGREHTLFLGQTEGYVGGSHARAALLEELQTALRDALLRYAHNLCHEGIQLGVSSAILEEALSAQEAAGGAKITPFPIAALARDPRLAQPQPAAPTVQAG